jgi:TPR repeat protein
MARHAAETLPPPRPLEELSYYPSGEHLKPATLEFTEAAADLAWLRAVQYYGEHRQTDNRFARMEHVFDILTTLAPHFLAPYEFGSFALAQEGFDFPAAERLMLKGLTANPRSGRLAFQAGFLYFVRPGGRDYRNAARYFAQAARQPDAPPQAARFAAFAGQQGGDLQLARELWAQVAQTSPNRYLREMAERQIRDIEAAEAAGRPDLVIRHQLTPRVLFKKP